MNFMTAGMVETTGGGHRQAAAALHALAVADRSLILAELPEADQAILCAHLAELDELGFDSGATAEVAAQDRHATAAVDGSPLDNARTAELHALLRGEPAVLVAQVLSMRAWRWRGDYLALQTGARREQLRTAAPSGAVAPARAQFLLAALEARLSHVPMAPATPEPARKTWPAWLGKLGLPWTR